MVAGRCSFSSVDSSQSGPLLHTSACTLLAECFVQSAVFNYEKDLSAIGCHEQCVLIWSFKLMVLQVYKDANDTRRRLVFSLMLSNSLAARLKIGAKVATEPRLHSAGAGVAAPMTSATPGALESEACETSLMEQPKALAETIAATTANASPHDVTHRGTHQIISVRDKAASTTTHAVAPMCAPPTSQGVLHQRAFATNVAAASSMPTFNVQYNGGTSTGTVSASLIQPKCAGDAVVTGPMVATSAPSPMMRLQPTVQTKPTAQQLQQREQEVPHPELTTHVRQPLPRQQSTSVPRGRKRIPLLARPTSESIATASMPPPVASISTQAPSRSEQAADELCPNSAIKKPSVQHAQGTIRTALTTPSSTEAALRLGPHHDKALDTSPHDSALGWSRAQSRDTRSASIQQRASSTGVNEVRADVVAASTRVSKSRWYTPLRGGPKRLPPDCASRSHSNWHSTFKPSQSAPAQPNQPHSRKPASRDVLNRALSSGFFADANAKASAAPSVTEASQRLVAEAAQLRRVEAARKMAEQGLDVFRSADKPKIPHVPSVEMMPSSSPRSVSQQGIAAGLNPPQGAPHKQLAHERDGLQFGAKQHALQLEKRQQQWLVQRERPQPLGQSRQSISAQADPFRDPRLSMHSSEAFPTGGGMGSIASQLTPRQEAMSVQRAPGVIAHATLQHHGGQIQRGRPRASLLWEAPKAVVDPRSRPWEPLAAAVDPRMHPRRQGPIDNAVLPLKQPTLLAPPALAQTSGMIASGTHNIQVRFEQAKPLSITSMKSLFQLPSSSWMTTQCSII